MKNLTQFILESRSWEPEDTDNISEFLSYLFFICKEQYNNAHNITLVAVKDNNNEATNWGDEDVWAWMHKINKHRDLNKLRIEFDAPKLKDIVSIFRKIKRPDNTFISYQTNTGDFAIDIDDIGKYGDLFIDALKKSNDIDKTIKNKASIKRVITSLYYAFDDSDNDERKYITLHSSKEVVSADSDNNLPTLITLGSGDKYRNAIDIFVDNISSSTDKNMYIEINKHIYKNFFNFIKDKLKDVIEDENGNIKINIKNAITNVDLICDTITN